MLASSFGGKTRVERWKILGGDQSPSMKPRQVLCLPQYGRLGASSRVRCHQYVAELKGSTVEFVVAPLVGDEYVRAIYGASWRRHLYGTTGIARRMILAVCEMATQSYDLVWLEKEIFPWCPPPLSRMILSRLNCMVDFDDAVFQRYEGIQSSLGRRCYMKSLEEVAQAARVITVGNEYLKECLVKAGARQVVVIPSSVDISKYPSSQAVFKGDRPVRIGWIGTPVTAKFVSSIAGALAKVQRITNCEVLLIGAGQAPAGLACRVVPWAEGTEVGELEKVDVGIMPLWDGPFERGKCGYKLIQYMASWKPVVASPVGVNRDIVSHGASGFLASSEDEWVDCLITLSRDWEMRSRMGRVGRAAVEARYSVQANASKLLSVILSSSK